MIREVDIVSYLPPFMAEFKEIAVTLKAENPEFALVWKAADRVLQNAFIETADEYGISRFEKVLNILPSREDTLESRRARVKVKWFDSIPYTWKVLVKKLIVLCGDTDFTLLNDFSDGYVLTLHTNLELCGQVEEIKDIIDTILPCNIDVSSHNSLCCSTKGSVCLGGSVSFLNTFTITSGNMSGTAHVEFVGKE